MTVPCATRCTPLFCLLVIRAMLLACCTPVLPPSSLFLQCLFPKADIIASCGDTFLQKKTYRGRMDAAYCLRFMLGAPARVLSCHFAAHAALPRYR